ncbi:MAG: hypothetical protein LBM98_09250 [Oscillospiraceae bacterium]|nr:hypothetical protein [Oscillospiraceae bacterium]
MRYAGRYRREAIQCWERNIRATYRKCGGGFAMTGEGASLIRGCARRRGGASWLAKSVGAGFKPAPTCPAQPTSKPP